MMTFDFLEINLSSFKRMLPFWCGAALTLFLLAVVDMPNNHFPYYPGWYGVWLFIQIGTSIPPLMILFGAGFQKLSLSNRLNIIYSYLILSWMSLVAVVFKSSMFFKPNIPTYIGFSNGIGISMYITQLYFVLGLLGISILISFWILYRKYVNSPEEMFP
jgi:hypothetical protein